MPPAVAKLTPGAQVGHFTLEALLGSGSYGQVYRGTDLRTGAAVAVKLEAPDTRPHLEDESRIYTVLEGGAERAVTIARRFLFLACWCLMLRFYVARCCCCC
jgi:hypothetical protein